MAIISILGEETPDTQQSPAPEQAAATMQERTAPVDTDCGCTARKANVQKAVDTICRNNVDASHFARINGRLLFIALCLMIAYWLIKVLRNG